MEGTQVRFPLLAWGLPFGKAASTFEDPFAPTTVLHPPLCFSLQKHVYWALSVFLPSPFWA
jgi:hypothetical protein